ncbi:DNA recombination protein RmuC [Demequina pelophila]|uniref:DNA recombination protein RmuC n=1 Tax=Demequina pelophila TaxID=1638984 RepID=UPI000783785A|nr:DNA recombination protein RmuC [Demequina pelophila]
MPLELLIALLSLACGAALGYVLASRRASSSMADAAVARARIGALEGALTEHKEASRRREAELRAEHERYVAQVRADEARLREQFGAVSADVLRANQEQLVAMAQERLTREREAGAAELAKREESVRRMVEPLAKTLDAVRAQTVEAAQAREAGQARLAEQVRQMLEATEKVGRKADDFINTLRRSDVRGNWGEVQLRRVVELAGMVQHVDFTEQDTVRDENGAVLRPDLTVRLAGGRSIVVDSKVALVALLEAFETDDEAVRAERLRAHATHMKRHVDSLAAKRYWAQFDSAPEFVVMFVPSEAFYQAALEQDPALQEYAYAHQVLIATPTTLVALLRTAALAWREESLAANARAVLENGRELYERLGTLGTHVGRLGRSLEQAAKHYNAAVGSLESRVMVSARRFGNMQHLEARLESVEPVSGDVRALTAAELVDDEAREGAGSDQEEAKTEPITP